MKHMTLFRAAALMLILMLTLGLAACGSQGSGQGGSSGKLDTPPAKNTESAQPENTPDTQQPENTPDAGSSESPADTPTPAEHTFTPEALAAIDELFASRQWEQYLAVAFLGYREEGDTTDLAAWMHNEAPALAAFWPFLTEIPAEDIIGDHGYLFCVVPLEERISFTVKNVEWNYEGNGSVPIYSDPLYDCEVGRPFLIYFNYGGIPGLWDDDPDTVLEYEEEYTKVWHPYKEPDGETTYDGDMIFDFAHLYDVGDYIPRLDDGPAPDSEWLPPTDLGLGNTTWYSDNGWMMEFSYDESVGAGSGYMVLYQPVEDGEGTVLSPYYEGTWWMEDDSLCLGVYEGNCPFPLLISPSGEQMVIMQADDGSVLPFFEEGQTTVGMTLSYG